MANIDDKGIFQPGQRKMRGSWLVEDALKGTHTQFTLDSSTRLALKHDQNL